MMSARDIATRGPLIPVLTIADPAHAAPLAEALLAGGAATLKAWQAPLPDLWFCPTGGVTRDNAGDYLALANVACVGGSWIAPAGHIAAADWAGITDLARAAICDLAR